MVNSKATPAKKRSYFDRAHDTVRDDHEFHPDAFTPGQLYAALIKASRAGQLLDGIKKTLVYGRELPADSPLRAAGDVPQFRDVPLAVKHGIIGMLTESSELADVLITTMFGDDDLDVINLHEEIGDVMWYMARICKAMQEIAPERDWTFEGIQDGNIAKLEKRHFKNGGTFDPTAVDHSARDLEGERAALENAARGSADSSGEGGEDDPFD